MSYTNPVEAGWDYAADVCVDLVEAGFAVLLLGIPASGKSTVRDMARERLPAHLHYYIVDWNGFGAMEPPPTDQIRYVLLGDWAGATVHGEFPELPPGFAEIVLRHVDFRWLGSFR